MNFGFSSRQIEECSSRHCLNHVFVGHDLDLAGIVDFFSEIYCSAH